MNWEVVMLSSPVEGNIRRILKFVPACYTLAMSPAMQKLRKSLDQAKSRHAAPASADAAGAHHQVGFDVIELLFTALVAQDSEIRRLRGGKSSAEDNTAISSAPDPNHPAANSDAYVGHIEAPAQPPVYTLKQALTPHGQKPGVDETA